MESYETNCGWRTRLVLIWGLYALAVAVVSELIGARGFPPLAGWAVGAAMGVAVLIWTREI